MAILRNGVILFDTREPESHVGVMAEPAVYRVEIDAPGTGGEPPIPWLVSNPIYVGMRAAQVRLALPHHIRNLARTVGELVLEVEAEPGGEVSIAAVLTVLEARFPALRGTLRDQATGRRRPFVRFFACQNDLSHQPMTAPLPREVVEGREVLTVLGAMAGG